MATDPTTPEPVAPVAQQPVVIKVEGGGGGPWPILLISALALIISPIVVGKMTVESNREGVDKDYVALAVTILNAKDSPPESRQWALKVLNKLAPVPFTDASKKSIQGGAPLYSSGQGMQAFGLKPLFKPGDPKIQPCPPVKFPTGKLTDESMEEYTIALMKAYGKCAVSHNYAVTMIDVLQGTNDTPQSIVGPFDELWGLKVKKPAGAATTPGA